MALPGNGLFGAIAGKNPSGNWSYAEAAESPKRRGFMLSKDDPQVLFRSIADIAASIAARPG